MRLKIQKTLTAKLRHKVELIYNATEDDYTAENWVKIQDIYAEIIAISEANIKELDGINFGHVMSEEYYLFTTRYIETINYKMRLKFGNRIFVIKRIINPYEFNHLLKIIVLEITEK